jgi:predicted O-methyltransferase YrrM
VPSIADVKSVVGDLPFMTLERAEAMTGLIHENDVRDVLELGFCHGVSTCYIAAALEQRGEGHVVTIDRASRILNAPSVEQLLDRLSVRHRAMIFYEYDSYNWRMQHFFAQSVRPEFDLIYLDGAHTWNVDGFAFLLAERLLAPGGVIVFDDLRWSFAKSQSTCTKTSAMPKDERDLEQVKLIFDLLVKPHPNIVEVWEDGNWGFARKRAQGAPNLDARDEALALIEQQAREVRERAESRVLSGEWEYPAWPGSLLPVLDTTNRSKLEDLRQLVDKLKRDRAWLEAKLSNDG